MQIIGENLNKGGGPRKRRQRTNAGVIDLTALSHLQIGENWFDGKHGPHSWVWAAVSTFHLFLMALFVSMPPMLLQRPEPIGVEIVTLPYNENLDPTTPVSTLNPVEKAPQEIIRRQQPPKEQQIVLDSPPQEQVVVDDVIVPPKATLTPPELIPPELVEVVPKLLPKPEKLNPKTSQIVTLNSDNIAIDEDLESQVAISEMPVLPKVTPNILRRDLPINLPQNTVENAISLEKRKLNQDVGRTVPNLDPNLRINEELLAAEQQARERAEAARAIEQSRNAAPKAAPNNTASNSAPIAKGGELAASSGAGVTAIAGGGAPFGQNGAGSPQSNGPNGGTSGAAVPAGTLPRGPRVVGNGRNLFETNQNGSLLAKMGRASECSQINRERDEKCPDWEPIERNVRNIPQAVPKGAARPITGVDPLPTCPIGTPHSNFGITCLPSRSAPNSRQ